MKVLEKMVLNRVFTDKILGLVAYIEYSVLNNGKPVVSSILLEE